MARFHHRIKSGKKGAAKENASYTRQHGKCSDPEDVVHVNLGNLPGWVDGDPIKFWTAAGTCERANGGACREIFLRPISRQPVTRLVVVPLTNEKG